MISLRRSTDRRVAMVEHMRGLQLAFTFFDAFDFETLSESFIASFQPVGRNGRPPRQAAVALAAGYKAICEEIASGPDEFVCVLEDDARLRDDAITLLDTERLQALPPFDVLRLGFAKPERKSGQVTVGAVSGIPMIAVISQGYATHAQIVSRQGAAKIAAGMTPLLGSIDYHLFASGRMPLRIVHPPSSVASARSFGSIIRPQGSLVRSVEEAAAARRELKIAEINARRSYRRAWGTIMYFRACLFDLGRRLHLFSS